MTRRILRMNSRGRSWRRACLLAAAVAATAVRAQAEPTPGPAASVESESTDDLDLMRLLNVEVSTASKTAESVDDAPAIITVVTRDEIRRWGYRDVADVLNHTVGFFAVDDHILPNVAVRGMSGGLGAESGAIKVMIDGRTVAYHTTSGNWLGTELIPLESVAQIEIIRGPASALYGADAFLGVVNIITLKPDEVRALQAKIAPTLTPGHRGGTFDAVSGTRVGKFDFMLGAAGESTDRSNLSFPPESPGGRFPSWVGTRRTALGLERRSLVLQGRAGYEDPGKGRISISAYGSGIERGGDFAQWAQLTHGTDAEGRPRGTTVALSQLRLDLSGIYHTKEHVDFALQSSYARGGKLPSDRIETGNDLFYVERRQSYQYVDGSLEARWVPGARFNLILGAEASLDHEDLLAPERVDVQTERSVSLGAGDGTRVNLTNFGAYVSSNLKIVDPGLKLSGGLRLDHHSVYGDQISGRAGIVSRLSSSVVLKFLYGNAFKAPSPYLLYATPLQPGDVIGNPRLAPQHVHTAEAQVSYKPSRFLGLTTGVSQSWLIDKAEFTPRGINLAAQNVAGQRSFAWESRVDVTHYSDYRLFGSYELVRSTRDLGQEGYAATLVGTRNVVYPAFIARAGAMVGIPSAPDVPLEAGVEAMVVGPRRAADVSIVERGASYDLPTYVVLDATLATRELYLVPGQETRIALRGKNILGSRGPDPGFAGFEYPLRPMEFLIELRHSL